MSIIISVLAFSFIIFIHELGHFITAKKAGIKVYEFSIGMGPKLFSKEKNGTAYSIRILPIGGFVRIKDDELILELEEEAEEKEILDAEKKDSFSDKSALKQILVLAAGGIMNFILGLILCAVILLIQGGINTPVIHSFGENAKSSAFLMEKDRIIKVDNTKVSGVMDLAYAFEKAESFTPDIVVERAGKEVLLSDVVFPTEYLGESKIEMIQYDFYMVKEKLSPSIFVKGTAHYFSGLSKIIIRGIGGLFSGKASLGELQGPIGISSEMKQTFEMGLLPFLLMVAMLSINLGIMNFMPLPIFDGGRILIIIIEKIVRRKIPPKLKAFILTACAIMLFFLVFVIMFADIKRLF